MKVLSASGSRGPACKDESWWFRPCRSQSGGPYACTGWRDCRKVYHRAECAYRKAIRLFRDECRCRSGFKWLADSRNWTMARKGVESWKMNSENEGISPSLSRESRYREGRQITFAVKRTWHKIIPTVTLVCREPGASSNDLMKRRKREKVSASDLMERQWTLGRSWLGTQRCVRYSRPGIDIPRSWRWIEASTVDVQCCGFAV